MRSPAKITHAFLALVMVASTFLGYWGYSIAQKTAPGLWMDVVTGQAQAPVQYRIGVILPAYWVVQHSHLAFRHIFAVVDLFSGGIAIFSLLALLRRSAAYRSVTASTHWVGEMAFVGLVQFYLMWLMWYQRPETLITAAVLALSFLLLTVRPPVRGLSGYLLSAVGLLLLAIAQGFIRADVAFSLHMGVLLVCLFSAKAGSSFALPRWWQAGVSLVAAGTCGALQVYLMHVVYPTARYIDGPMFQLWINLKTPTEWVPFLLFLTPLLWTAATLVRRRELPEGPVTGFLAGACMFLGLWLIAGRIEEVRIFLPFALGLAPLTALLAMQRYTSWQSEGAPSSLHS